MELIYKIEHSSWTRKKILIFLGILIVMVVVLEIWSINRLATYGEQINKLDRIKASLKVENQVLANQIAQKSSLSSIEKYTIYLGFEKAKNIEVVKDSGLALNH